MHSHVLSVDCSGLTKTTYHLYYCYYFSCGHSYHAQCGGESASCVMCAGSTQEEKPTEEIQHNDTSDQPLVGSTYDRKVNLF